MVYFLFSGSTVGMNNIKTMKINDVEVTPVSATRFSTTGENTYYVEVIEPVTNMSEMFYNCDSLTSLDLSNWDTSKVTKMISMFYYCLGLTTLDSISNWDTSNVTNMGQMFKNCYGLITLDLSNWDTSNVISMYGMFSYCTSLTSVGDLSNWDTSNVISCNQMFYHCYDLASLDLSNWDTSKVTDMSYMFSSCSGLTEVRMGGNPSSLTKVNDMFYGINTTGTFYYNSVYDYSKIIAELPSTWTAIPCTLVDGVLVPNE